MIPKTIHFIWIGPNQKNRLIQKCINSWYKLHPNWIIKEWSNKDFTFDDCVFVKIAYKNKNWAYLSDYYRMKVLWLYGGIYLDTDMLLIKPLDLLLNSENIWGYETENIISCGIIGSKKENSFINSILKYYQALDQNNWNKNTIPEIVTKIALKNPYDPLNIYPIEFFYPYPAECRLKEININYKKYITSNTIGIHLWEYSWSYFSRYQLFLKDKKVIKAMLAFMKESITKKNTFKPSELMKTVRIILRR
jgi:hypothetical protein